MDMGTLGHFAHACHIRNIDWRMMLLGEVRRIWFIYSQPCTDCDECITFEHLLWYRARNGGNQTVCPHCRELITDPTCEVIDREEKRSFHLIGSNEIKRRLPPRIHASPEAIRDADADLFYSVLAREGSLTKGFWRYGPRDRKYAFVEIPDWEQRTLEYRSIVFPFVVGDVVGIMAQEDVKKAWRKILHP